MTVVITGAKGQLGREWTEYLTKQGVQTIPLASSNLDITDRKSVVQVLSHHKPETVINCAAYNDVDGAEDELNKAMKVNRDGVENLVDWCSENRATVIHFSTDYVFPGNKADLVRYSDGYPEDAQRAPVNNYGKSKLAGEQVLLGSNVDFILIRVSWLCGKHGKNFVTTMLRLAEEKEELRVVNDQVGSPAFTDSVVKHTYRLLNNGHRGVFHISSKGMLSWFDFATEIFRLTDIEINVVPVSSIEFASKAARPVFSKLSNSKICSTLNVEMERWQDGLTELINNLK